MSNNNINNKTQKIYIKKKDNITLDLFQYKLKNEEVDWDKYSKDVFNSIELVEEKEDKNEEKQIGINPFLEDQTVFEETSINKSDKTLEKEFIDSWDQFKLKELQKVADFYDIPYKGKTKNKLIEKIIEFEQKEENYIKVFDREVNWNKMNELSKDKFFSKYIINWNI